MEIISSIQYYYGNIRTFASQESLSAHVLAEFARTTRGLAVTHRC